MRSKKRKEKEECGNSVASTTSSSSTSSGEIEISARNLLDITFKYTWTVRDYITQLDNGSDIDSPIFEFYLNGLKTKWSLSIRFWDDGHGTRLSNPVVVCLNLVASICEIPEEIEVRYQFGVWNEIVKQHEVCPIASQSVSLAGPVSDDLTSLPYREVCILDQHLHDKNSIELFCRIMLVRSKVEENTLALDLWSKMKNKEFCDVTLVSSDGNCFPVHKTIISCRSSGLSQLVAKALNDVVPLKIPSALLTELLQYIYTDRVDPLKAPTALLRVAVDLELPGLKNICVKALTESITQFNVANMLMIADTFSCDQLKKAGLAYVEENARSIVKTMAWKVMEHVNPELFEEVCGTQG